MRFLPLDRICARRPETAGKVFQFAGTAFPSLPSSPPPPQSREDATFPGPPRRAGELIQDYLLRCVERGHDAES